MPDQPQRAGASRAGARAGWGRATRPSKLLRRAVQLKPELPDAWRALGDHYTALEMREAADGAYAQHHPLFDARSEAHGRGAGAAREPHSRSGSAAARTPEAPSDRRRRDPHAGRSRGAPRPLSPMRRTCWRAASSSRRASAPRGTTTPWCCTGRTSRKPRCARCEHAARRRPAQSRATAISRPRSSGASASTTQSIEHYRSVLADYPQPAEGLDELRPRAEDRRPATPRASTPTASCIELRAASRRGVLEPREPQDVPLHARRDRRRCARSSRAPSSRHDDRFHFDFALGKALEDAGEYAESFEHYARGQSPAPRADPLRRRRERTRTSQRSKTLFTRRVLRRARAASAVRRPTRSSSSACRAPARR